MEQTRHDDLARALAATARLRRAAIAATAIVALVTAGDPGRRAAAEPIDIKREYETLVLDHEDGLPDIAVASVAEGPDGRLWFSSFRSLGTFDGMYFSGAGVLPADTRTRKVFLDPSGRLWAGAKDKVLSLDGGIWTAHPLPADTPSVTIATFARGGDGTLWAGGYGKLFRLVGHRFEAVEPPAGYRENDFFGLATDAAGEVWCCHGGTLAVWRGGAWQRALEMPEDGSERFMGLAPARGGGLWVATRPEIRLWRDGAWTRTVARPEGARGDELALLEDSRGTLWAGGWVSGITLFSRQGEASRFTVRDGLPGNSFPQLVEDSQGDVWAACNGGGLVRFRPRAARRYGVEDGLEQIANSVAIDADGRVLVGTHGNGLMVLDGARVRVHEHWDNARFSSGSWVHAVLRDASGEVWAGTANEGLFRISTAGMEQFREGDIGSASVFGLAEDREGRLWIATADGVALREGGAFRVFGEERGLPRARYHGVVVDAAGEVWVCGAPKGVFRLRGDRFEPVELPGMDIDSPVMSILVARDGTLWIGADPGGLARVRGDEVVVFGPDRGLPVMDCSALVEDDEGNLWIGGARKVAVVSGRSLSEVADGTRAALDCRVFDTRDGVPGPVRVRMQSSGCRGPDGQVWFATLKGLSSFDPARLPPHPVPPPAALRSVILDGEAREGIGADSPPLLVTPGDRLEVGYSATCLATPERVLFQRRLHPDASWDTPTNDRQVQLQDLKPGRYRLEVRAAGSDGVWGNPATVPFEVAPFVWQRWWFQAGAVAVGAAIAALLVRRRVAALEKEQRLQEEFARNLLDREESLRQRMATDLHDSLGQTLQVIRNRAVLAKRQSSEPAVATHVDSIADTASLAIGEMRAIVGNLHPSHLEHLGLSAALRQLATDTANAGGMAWQTSIDPVDGLLPRDKEIHCYRIVQEALGNVLRHSGATRAGLTIARLPEGLRLEVWDDGPGLRGGPERGDLLDFPGLGLRSLKERAAILGGTCRFLSAPQGGLLVAVEIPLPKIPAPGSPA